MRRCDILIITAKLADRDAVRDVALLAEVWQQHHHGDIPYLLGRMGLLRVALACTHETGETAVATLAAALIGPLDPTCVAMCGPCSGRRGKVSLGDVIIVDRTYSYDHGKIVASRDANGVLHADLFRDIKTYNLDRNWRIAATELRARPDLTATLADHRPPSAKAQNAWLLAGLDAHEQGEREHPVKDPERARRCPDWPERVLALKDAGLVALAGGTLSITDKGRTQLNEDRIYHPDHESGYPGDPPLSVHIGPIATGKTERMDPDLFASLDRCVLETVGVDTEVAALGKVAEDFQRKWIVVKSVENYADHDNDPSFGRFASQAAAEVLLRFLASQTAPASDGRRLDIPAGNPYHVEAGPLPYDHRAYVVRMCDGQLTTKLEKTSLVALVGDAGVGKSSLVKRLGQAPGFPSDHRVSTLNLRLVPMHDPERFYTYIFRTLSLQLGRPVQWWDDLCPIVLVVDEFVALTPQRASEIVGNFVHMALEHPGRFRVVACLTTCPKNPGIREFLEQHGVDRPNHLDPWATVSMSAMTIDDVAHLFGMLPSSVDPIAVELRARVTELSQGDPKAIQRICSHLFAGASAGQSDAELLALARDQEKYHV